MAHTMPRYFYFEPKLHTAFCLKLRFHSVWLRRLFWQQKMYRPILKCKRNMSDRSPLICTATALKSKGMQHIINPCLWVALQLDQSFTWSLLTDFFSGSFLKESIKHAYIVIFMCVECMVIILLVDGTILLFLEEVRGRLRCWRDRGTLLGQF